MAHINLLGTFIFMIIGYLIGSISASIIISKQKFKTDVREHYSKNAGATNAKRLMGQKWGIIVFAADAIKPMIAIFLAYSLTFINISNANFHNLFKTGFLYATGLAAIIGHCWPIFFNFRGGKGAASALGLLFIINPIYCIAAVICWFVVLALSKMVSLASILMVGVAFGLSWIPNMPFNAYLWPHDQQFYIINIIIGLTWMIVIVRHYANLQRIFIGTERKANLFHKKNGKTRFVVK